MKRSALVSAIALAAIAVCLATWTTGPKPVRARVRTGEGRLYWIRSPLDEPAFLKSIVAADAVVKKGDVVAQLESPRLIEMIEAQTHRVRRMKAKIKDKALHVEVAKIALEEYRKGLSEQDLKFHEANIIIAKQGITRAQKALDLAKVQTGLDQELRIENAEAGLMQAQIDLEKAEISLKVFQMYSKNRKIAELREEINRASLVDAETQAELDYEQGKLDRLTKMAASGKLLALAGGKVLSVTGGPNDPNPLDEGARIHPGQVVLEIVAD